MKREFSASAERLLSSTSGRLASAVSSSAVLVDLGPGDPAYGPPRDAIDAMVGAVKGGLTHYTAVTGTIALREAVRNKFSRDHHVSYEVDDIVVGAGSKQLIAYALMATLRDRDEVVVPTPYYSVYPQMIEFAGGTFVPAETRSQAGYRIEARDLPPLITAKTRWLILNSPCNPSGVVYSASELADIAAVLRGYPQVGVLSDEIYADTYFGDTRPVAFASIDRSLFDRTMTVSGISKSFGMTGLRIGFAGGPGWLMQTIGRMMHITTSCASSVSQEGARAALEGGDADARRWRQRLCDERELVVEKLTATPLLTPNRPEGGLYVLADCSASVGMTTPAGTVVADDVDLCQYLSKFARVRLMPGSAFGAPGTVRVSFGVVGRDRLEWAMDAIAQAMEALKWPRLS